LDRQSRRCSCQAAVSVALSLRQYRLSRSDSVSISIWAGVKVGNKKSISPFGPTTYPSSVMLNKALMQPELCIIVSGYPTFKNSKSFQDTFAGGQSRLICMGPFSKTKRVHSGTGDRPKRLLVSSLSIAKCFIHFAGHFSRLYGR
jgi:hypothetical protein